MKRIIGFVLAVLVFAAGPAFAQRELSHTTLSQAITSQSSSADQVRIASLTGVTAGSTSLWIDHEMMTVLRILNTITFIVQVQRGSNGTRAELHASAAVVTVVPAGAVTAVDYVGACTQGSGEDALFEPLINATLGHMGRCRTSKWIWSDTLTLTYNSSPY